MAEQLEFDLLGICRTTPTQGARAEYIELADDTDFSEYCLQAGFDSLPIVPPTSARVERMMRAVTLAPEQIIALVPPNYGPATIEKIAANAARIRFRIR